MRTIMNFIREEEGATALEYGLLAALIAGAIVTIVGTLGTTINDVFTTLSNKMSGAASTGS